MCLSLSLFPSLSVSVCVSCRYPGERLHQRQLHRWLQEAERLHRYPGATGGDFRGLLEDGVGAAGRLCRHDDASGREVAGEDTK